MDKTTRILKLYKNICDVSVEAFSKPMKPFVSDNSNLLNQEIINQIEAEIITSAKDAYKKILDLLIEESKNEG
jgi:hypothetical protein